MVLKNYSFNLDTEKHKDIIEWIKDQQENELNFSALVRKILREEINKRVSNEKKNNN